MDLSLRVCTMYYYCWWKKSPNNHLGCIKPCKEWEKLPLPQLVIAGFLPSTGGPTFHDMRGSLLRRLFPMREMHRAENFAGKSSELANPEPIISIRSLKDHSFTLPETNSSHLKMDGWKNTIVSFWDSAYFQVAKMLTLGVLKHKKPSNQRGDCRFLGGLFFFSYFYPYLGR